MHVAQAKKVASKAWIASLRLQSTDYPKGLGLSVLTIQILQIRL